MAVKNDNIIITAKDANQQRSTRRSPSKTSHIRGACLSASALHAFDFKICKNRLIKFTFNKSNT